MCLTTITNYYGRNEIELLKWVPVRLFSCLITIHQINNTISPDDLMNLKIELNDVLKLKCQNYWLS